MNLEPLGDRLIVEVLEEEEQTMSGIVLPDTAKEKPQRGKVLAVGPGGGSNDSHSVSGRNHPRPPGQGSASFVVIGGQADSAQKSNTGSTRTTRALGPRHRVEKALSDHPGRTALSIRRLCAELASRSLFRGGGSRPAGSCDHLGHATAWREGASKASR
jgi:hypothetical protein